jgi:hypothetical protein
LEIKQEIMQRLQEMKQDEEIGVILEAQMEDIQTQTEELIDQKDMDYHQETIRLRGVLRV